MTMARIRWQFRGTVAAPYYAEHFQRDGPDGDVQLRCRKPPDRHSSGRQHAYHRHHRSRQRDQPRLGAAFCTAGGEWNRGIPADQSRTSRNSRRRFRSARPTSAHFFLPFDNAANTTSIALANPDPATTATINVTFRYVDGTSNTGQLTLPPQNYTRESAGDSVCGHSGQGGSGGVHLECPDRGGGSAVQSDAGIHFATSGESVGA